MSVLSSTSESLPIYLLSTSIWSYTDSIDYGRATPHASRASRPCKPASLRPYQALPPPGATATQSWEELPNINTTPSLAGSTFVNKGGESRFESIPLLSFMIGTSRSSLSYGSYYGSSSCGIPHSQTTSPTSVSSLHAKPVSSPPKQTAQYHVEPIENQYISWRILLFATLNTSTLVTQLVDVGITSSLDAFVISQVATRLVYEAPSTLTPQLHWESIRRFQEYFQLTGPWCIENISPFSQDTSMSHGTNVATFIAYLVQAKLIAGWVAHNCVQRLLFLSHDSDRRLCFAILTAVDALIRYSGHPFVDWAQGVSSTSALLKKLEERNDQKMYMYVWGLDERCEALRKTIRDDLSQKLVTLRHVGAGKT
ncbi:hypothetical protein R3P38DRAFT_3560013 [Favolaschia claudopus]|uniref:Uncharacterized protein n=1 Tax=Favolaschia claudopus TaxID=2862362 RepID=A0AAW0B021_9AGAR